MRCMGLEVFQIYIGRKVFVVAICVLVSLGLWYHLAAENIKISPNWQGTLGNYQLDLIFPEVNKSQEPHEDTIGRGTHENEGQTMKIILFWNSFFGKKDFKAGGFGQIPFLLPDCPENRCLTTRNRSQLTEASAVLFHVREINYNDMPPFRPPRQLYVFFLAESPFTTQTNLTNLGEMFNITMTYRMDSDIPMHILYKYNPSRITTEGHKLSYPLKMRKKSVVYVNSRCGNALRWRQQYIDELSKYIDIDIYGSCGKPLEEAFNCLPDDCFSKVLPSMYKFYLSFENSICKDYVTEKLSRTMETEIVPIVLGGTNYTRDMPPHAAIDVMDFETPEKLAKYLKFLSANEIEYLRYYDWKATHIPVNLGDKRFCGLCEILHNRSFHKIYSDIHSWWRDGMCGCQGNFYKCNARRGRQ